MATNTATVGTYGSWYDYPYIYLCLALFEIDLLFNQLIHLCLPFETSQITDSNERDQIIFWGNMSHL